MSSARDPDKTHRNDARSRVLLVDDHPLFRRGLASVLSVEDWVGEVHETDNADESVSIAVTRHIDVVAMDLRLGGDQDGRRDGHGAAARPEGLAATEALLRARPAASVLVLTMVMDDSYVAQALTLGARGYLLKSADPSDVVDALHLVAGGGLVLGSGVGPVALRSHQQRWPAPFENLTDGEQRLVRLLAVGASNARIARELGVSDKTVRNRISVLLVRLGVPDRVAVALLARDRALPRDES